MLCSIWSEESSGQDTLLNSKNRGTIPVEIYAPVKQLISMFILEVRIGACRSVAQKIEGYLHDIDALHLRVALVC